MSEPNLPKTAEQVAQRLRRIQERPNAAAAGRARIKLAYQVLEAIANQSAADPSQMAAAVLQGFTQARGPKQIAVPASEGLATAYASLIAEANKRPAPIDQNVLDYLYERSRVQLPRQEWEDAVRHASSLFLAMRELRRSLDWESLMDTAATEQAFSKLTQSNSRGVLLLTCHGGYVVAAQELFRRKFKNGAFLARKALLGGENYRFDNFRDGAFAAFRLLQDGGLLLMAPDGGWGRQSARFEVFGHTTQVGDGAAFLAHASKSNTAWYNVVRQSDRFAPVIEFGPTLDAGESLDQFAGRLHKFYATKIEQLFSGDPRNISLSSNWPKRFQAAIDAAK